MTTNSQTNYPILYGSTIVAGLSFVKPEVAGKLVRQYGFDDISGWIDMLGAREGIANLEFFHGETEGITEVIKVSAASAGSANAAVTLTVASGYRQTTSQTAAPYIATGSSTTIPVGVNDVIQFPDGTLGSCTAVSGNTFTVIPVVSGANIPAVTTSSVLKNITTAVKEGADSVAAKFKNQYGYRNNMTRIRTSSNISGDSFAIRDWITNYGKSGASPHRYSEQLMDDYHRHRNKCELAKLIGQRITNTTLANTSGFETVLLSEGLIPWLESNANVVEYASTAAFSLAEIDTMGDYFTKYRGADTYDLWTDRSLSLAIDDVIGTDSRLAAGSVVYDNAREEKYANFGFDGFKRGGILFKKKMNKVFNLPEYLGGDNAYHNGIGILVPTDNVVTAPFGGSKPVSVPSLRTVYQISSDLPNKGTKEWSHGGSADVPTSGERIMKYEVETVEALEPFAANRWGLFKIA